MTNNAILLGLVIGRCFAASVALAGATWLAMAGKEGWGWLIFSGIVLGWIGISTKGKEIKAHD